MATKAWKITQHAVSIHIMIAVLFESEVGKE